MARSAITSSQATSSDVSKEIPYGLWTPIPADHLKLPHFDHRNKMARDAITSSQAQPSDSSKETPYGLCTLSKMRKQHLRNVSERLLFSPEIYMSGPDLNTPCPDMGTFWLTKAISHFNLRPDNANLEYKHWLLSKYCNGNLSPFLSVQAAEFSYRQFNKGEASLIKCKKYTCSQCKNATATTVVFLPESMHKGSSLDIHGTAYAVCKDDICRQQLHYRILDKGRYLHVVVIEPARHYPLAADSKCLGCRERTATKIYEAPLIDLSQARPHIKMSACPVCDHDECKLKATDFLRFGSDHGTRSVLDGTKRCTACWALPQGSAMFCGACKKARYCGGECQKAHWKEHKAKCGASERA